MLFINEHQNDSTDLILLDVTVSRILLEHFFLTSINTRTPSGKKFPCVITTVVNMNSQMANKSM